MLPAVPHNFAIFPRTTYTAVLLIRVRIYQTGVRGRTGSRAPRYKPEGRGSIPDKVFVIFN